jgi:hypothetical protein
MPPQKRRNKTRIYVDAALCIKIRDFAALWKSTFGEDISEIEMGRIFGEFGKLNLLEVKKTRDFYAKPTPVRRRNSVQDAQKACSRPY